MNYISEISRAWQHEALVRFIKWAALVIVVLYFGIAVLGYYSRNRCTAADKALSQAPAFDGPVDEADAKSHPEKLQYARAQIRAIQKCGW